MWHRMDDTCGPGVQNGSWCSHHQPRPRPNTPLYSNSQTLAYRKGRVIMFAAPISLHRERDGGADPHHYGGLSVLAGTTLLSLGRPRGKGSGRSTPSALCLRRSTATSDATVFCYFCCTHCHRRHAGKCEPWQWITRPCFKRLYKF